MCSYVCVCVCVCVCDREGERGDEGVERVFGMTRRSEGDNERRRKRRRGGRKEE